MELNELFNLHWRRIIPLGQISSIAFSRLDREASREPVPQPDTITPAIITNTSFVFSSVSVIPPE